MTTHRERRIATAVATFPLVWVVLLYLFVIRARFHFGHWPSAFDGMAKSMGFAFHHQLVIYALLTAPWVALGLIVGVIVLRRRDSSFPVGRPLVALAASVVVSLALFTADPGSFILWFFD